MLLVGSSTGLRQTWHAWLAVAAVVLISYLIWTQTGPPPELPGGARPEFFSLSRARRDIQEIARVPHPVGSPENARVRDYIVRQLEALGIAVSVERQTAFYRSSGAGFQGGMVENIIGRIPGAANTKAVMLACHYDSVVEDGGAADDGAGIAVLLETARAVRHDHPLRNDLLLLFTDGEEPDLLGSAAFVSQSPRARDVGLVLNFEARGVSGPVLMFQTSQPDGSLIREFARAAPNPRAASFFRHVYERMPSATDFTFFDLKGIPGLNFAFIEEGGFYHTSEDNLNRLDGRALEHEGRSALALVNHFGNLPLPLPAAPAMVYFNAGNVLVHYPLAWVWGIEIVLCALWVGAIYAAGRRSSLRLALLGLLGVAGIELAMTLIPYCFLSLLRKLHLFHGELSFGQEYGRWWFLGAALILGGMAALRLASRLAARVGAVDMCVAVVLMQLMLSGLACARFPAAAHLAMAGAVTGLFLLGLTLWKPRSPAMHVAAVIVALLPALVIWVPLARHLDAGLGVDMWPVQTFLISQLMVFLSAAIVPAVFAPSIRTRIAVAAVTAVLLAAGIASSRYDARHPRPANVFYALDADRHAAYWATRKGALDPWTAQILGPERKRQSFPQISPLNDEPFWRSPAPELPLAPPQLELVRSECAGGFRTFELNARSLRGARSMLIVAQSDRDTELLSLNGRAPTVVEPFTARAHRAEWVELRALPPQGLSLGLRILGCGKLVSRVVERSHDSEAVFPHGVPPLPVDGMTEWEDDVYNRSVVVSRFFSFQ